jgi:hypothetical protein
LNLEVECCIIKATTSGHAVKSSLVKKDFNYVAFFTMITVRFKSKCSLLQVLSYRFRPYSLNLEVECHFDKATTTGHAVKSSIVENNFNFEALFATITFLFFSKIFFSTSAELQI